MISAKQIADLWTHVYASGIGDVEQGLIVISHLFILKQLEHQAPDNLQNDESHLWWQVIKTMAREDSLSCLQTRLRGQAR